jgi:glycosyltransferase involved in cell wall biosynthesis
MTVPKVSVLTPVYNTQENHLRECIESILNQTYSDFEFVILNDASTDSNIETIVKSYDDPRIVYAVNERNLGISLTRNKLMQLARGEYFAVFDHDDISYPDRLEKEVAYLDSHPEVGVVSGQADVLTDRRDNRVWRVPETSEAIQRKLLTDSCVIHPACMLRRSVLEKFKIQYEEAYSPAEDYALFCRLVGKTEFYNFQRSLIKYRNHRDNTTHRRSELMRLHTRSIQSFVQRENAELWDLVRFQCFRKRSFRLFRFLPILQIEEWSDRTDFYLFGFIPLWSVTTKPWREK